MRPFLFTLAVLSGSLPLSGCSFINAITPLTAHERAGTGVYEGMGTGVTGRVPYRLVLTIDEKNQQASGVLTNLSSRKIYAGSGTFKKTPVGGYIMLRLYENGNSHRANIDAELDGPMLRGKIHTVLLGRDIFPYEFSMQKIEQRSELSPQPVAATASTNEPPRMPGQP